MKPFSSLTPLAAAAYVCTITGAFAQESCKSFDRIPLGKTVYAIAQEARKNGDKIERLTKVYLPESAEYISDVNMRTNFKVNALMREEQTRIWTMELTPQGARYSSTKPKYKFIYAFSPERKNNASLPKWSRNVKDKPLKSCSFHKDGQEEFYKAGVRYGLECTVPVTDKVRAKMSGLQFIEVRGMNLKKNEIVRAQYSIHYPQAVKDKLVQSGNAMDQAVAKGTCAPLQK